MTCRAENPKTETQIMANLPLQRLQPHSPPFHYTSCEYFGPLIVKVSQNKTTKHYGVSFTCLNTRAVHLEIATDCSAMEFIQTLRRFFSIRAVARALIGGGGCIFIYSSCAPLVSFEIKLISKEVSRAEPEYMNIHPPN